MAKTEACELTVDGGKLWFQVFLETIPDIGNLSPMTVYPTSAAECVTEAWYSPEPAGHWKYVWVDVRWLIYLLIILADCLVTDVAMVYVVKDSSHNCGWTSQCPRKLGCYSTHPSAGS